MRLPVAFLVAPLGAPLVIFLISLPIVLSDHPFTPLVIFAMLHSLIAYPITLVFGVPLYWIMRRLEMTQFWVAPGLGCSIALALCTGFAVLLSENLPGGILLFATLGGAAVGAIFWLIVRPDRYAAPTSR